MMTRIQQRSPHSGPHLGARFLLLGCMLLGCAHSPPVPRMTPGAAEALRAEANQALVSHVPVVKACLEQARGVGELATVAATVSLLPIAKDWAACGAELGPTACEFAKCLHAKSKELGLPELVSEPPLGVLLYLRGAKATTTQLRPVYPGTDELVSADDISVLKAVGILWSPQRLSGEPLDYSFAGLMEGTEGSLVVKCRLDERGALSDCHVLKELVHLTESNLERLKTWRYKPARWNDTPVAVDYTFRAHFSMAP